MFGNRFAIATALPFVVGLTACVLSQRMPPFSATRSYAAMSSSAPAGRSALPARRVFNHRKRFDQEYDQATDQTRVSVTTHRGTYFLWIQRPRLTFFYAYDGTALRETPASVFLVFRTVDPQQPSSNRLILTCDAHRQDLEVTPVFWLEPGPMTTSRHYMYELPLNEFTDLLACRTAILAIGDVAAPFAVDQLEALRDLAAGMHVE